MQKKAILFDSSRVLNHPRTGNWFIPPNFNKIVNVNKTNIFNYILLIKAIKKATRYIDEQKFILTEEEEFRCFLEFYKIIAKEPIGIKLSEEQIFDITKDSVYNDDKFLFPNEVLEIIPILSENYKLGVIADTCPSLERAFINIGLRKYFSTFIMSSKVGVKKPDKLIFTTALKELNIEPEEAIFIDNKEVNVEGAEKIGMKGVLMLEKNNSRYNKKFLAIKNLMQIEEAIKNKC
ncbi:putative hydrolase of the HAD superfamily [Clostridium acidisoli DSM 12555]|jgi:putative hydrolase of the HAD superfamily|uniref:Putative hydrolase of the HAD superfamily n=1 Tax=Clostridium acidisoli DSM 12555 TaxID=1121291 RepID=A0A1W1XV77_9CLOT|nr:HAD-IA family hydrolase [Clostridium acidisoli]SMC27765.1 putative hydrolase of the HAD superfamily [Clostridium acidisoli DSM 12555]